MHMCLWLCTHLFVPPFTHLATPGLLPYLFFSPILQFFVSYLASIRVWLQLLLKFSCDPLSLFYTLRKLKVNINPLVALIYF